MISQINQNSRTPSTLVIPAGAIAPQYIGGDFFYIYSLTGVLTISVNEDDFAPCQVGLIHSGVIGRNDISSIRFKNSTASSVTVVLIYGKGSMPVTGQTSIVNPTFTLDTPTVQAITPPAAVLQASFANLSNQAAVAYNGKRSISIANTGAVQILVNGIALAAGSPPIGFTCERVQDTLPNFSIDTITTPNGTALVLWTSA